MHLILTHEQADFDAVASQLGAHLLNETAVPVVSRKQNRNVRAFLTFYGADLPFVEARDLPSKPVRAVTLVDTQSLTSVKGMSAETRVHVIDHHPLREDLPPEWEITVSGTGANTTVFVEALREGMRQEMERDASVFVMGEGVGPHAQSPLQRQGVEGDPDLGVQPASVDDGGQFR